METEELTRRIESLKKERRAIILAHNYQRPEIQDIADYLGDSLELSRIAAETDAEVLVFCGVQFMAETAAILSPEKTVLLPVKEAGCPLADMATPEQIRKARKKYPQAAVVSYVNTSAEAKAESDACCTSGNAIEVVNSIENDQVIFVPDMNLGRYVALHTDKEIILWQGWCPTHMALQATDLAKYPLEREEVKFMAHPECLPEVLELADRVAGTAGILSYVPHSVGHEFIVGTEMGLVHRLEKEYPGRKFYPPTEYLICPTMKMTTLQHVLEALKKMQHVIRIEEEVRIRARRALDAMLAAT